MTNRFLISAAVAALITGTGFANAQGTGSSREQPSAGSTVQQNAPSPERGGAASGTMHRDSGASGMKGAESTKGSDSHGMKASESNEKMPSSKSAQDMKAEGRDSKTGNMNAETKGATDSKTGGSMNAQTKSPADAKSQTTTGNAATSATAAPPAEKQTQ